ncbi:Uncharacterised protein [Mycobacteroides abscessus subsp. abscessus]|nr:Uncharacterised protein [Mycobacteroides abscessus subsp. abscessus]SIE75281.1 Uncharacterised protein [Mycobacteroides abscessus subsp. abscessus]SIG88743.1 Uncharacterised protein [Mycobacteroides abscessus subsp. abscessus]SIG92888.1 Uncharacterised protein [Mycobacteroides abscessus subsp. abscessus]SIH06100.1 Uncharacterised protein [Mycobacteroides abscessus subsp. abscessus]
MNTLVAHIQMVAFMAHAGGHETPAPRPGHDGTHARGGLFDQFFNSAVRGAGWSMGSRIMHALPIGADCCACSCCGRCVVDSTAQEVSCSVNEGWCTVRARLILTFAFTAFGLVALSGCAATAQVDTSPRDVKLGDGTTVTCVVAIDRFNGGSASPSCNWERYNQLHPVESGAGRR